PGLGNGRKIEKLGLRSSDTAEVILENVRVRAEHLIGEENQGFKQALRLLDAGRVGIAAWCPGNGRAALETRSPTPRSAPPSAARSPTAGDPVHARRHGDAPRCRAPAHLPRCVLE